MKKVFVALFISILATTAILFSSDASAQRTDLNDRKPEADVIQVSPNLVISQFQAGGASANDEFIEIHNNGPAAVDLNGYRIVYRAQNGVNDVNFFAWTQATPVQPGQYYLVASTVYSGSAVPNATFDNAVCACALSATNGGLAIRQGAANTGTVIDAVGWGTGTNIFFEGTRTTAPANSSSKRRFGGGCTDTDNNVNDFEGVTPSQPRNASASPFPCSGGGTSLFAAMAANPTSVVPGGNVLFTVTVIPATTPPSTAIEVIGNLTQIGGSNLQQFYDDGTHGDVTVGDNVFTFDALVPANTTGGTKNITAVASDAEMRFANVSVNITVNIPGEAEDPLLFGNPSNATPDVSNENNYLMIKPQYSLSYNRSKATPNWTAWRLDSSWIGSTPRQDDFRPDDTLPAAWYHVQPADYSEPVYDRGHMCPSGDRTNSVPNNSATFLMTNMVPQIPDNNQGPWEEFESYCRTMAGEGKEIYIISGPQGQDMAANGGLGYIGNHVMVPASTWKVVLIMPNGTDDLHRLGKRVRVFGIIMSNISIGRNTPWRNFRVTVDQVEALTGFDFFSNVNPRLQTRLESVPDTQ